MTRHRAFCLISHFRLHHNSKKYLHQHWFPHLKGLHSNGQIFHSSTYSVHHNSIHLSQCQIHSHLLHWMLNRYTKMLLPKPLFQCRFHHYNSFLIFEYVFAVLPCTVVSSIVTTALIPFPRFSVYVLIIFVLLSAKHGNASANTMTVTQIIVKIFFFIWLLPLCVWDSCFTNNFRLFL